MINNRSLENGYQNARSEDALATGLLLAVVVGTNVLLAYRYDGLLHDDAANIAFVLEHGRRSWFGIPFEFNAVREDIKGHLAAYASPFLARLYIAVVYMGGACFLFWRLLRDRFQIDTPVAFAVAALPFLTWSIWQIPIGINISYVAGDVFYALIAATLIAIILTDTRASWLKLICVAFAFYIATEVMPSATVITPLLFLFAATFGPAQPGWRIVMAGSMAVACLLVLGGEVAAERRGIVASSVIWSNLIAAFGQVPERFNPRLPAIVWWAALGLAVAGAGGIMARFMNQMKQAGWREVWTEFLTGSVRLCAVAMITALLIYSLAPYLLTSSSWPLGSQERYYYIWQFGFWSVFGVGTAWITRILSNRALDLAPALQKLGISAAVVVAMMLTGWVGLAAFHRAFTPPPAVTQATNFTAWLRREFTTIKTGQFDQVLLVMQPGVQTGLSHISNPTSGRGYLSFILGERVRHGVVALSNRCSHIFDPLVSNWGYYEVSGFAADRSLRAFRIRPGDRMLFEFRYGLDFTAAHHATVWAYGDRPQAVLTVANPEQLQAWLEAQELTAADVAWAESYMAGSCIYDDRQFR